MLGVDFKGAKFKLSHTHKLDKLCYYLPYNFFVGQIDEGIILLKPGALCRCYTFTCPDLGSASAESINAISSYFNSSLRQLGTEWACHFESRREYTDKYPSTKWKNQLGYLMDARRKDNYVNRTPHFVNYFFMTLTYQVKSDIVSKGSSLLYKDSSTENDSYYNIQKIEREIQFFRDVTEEITSFIASRISLNKLDNDEALTYLSSTITTEWLPRFAPLTPVFFDEYLTYKNIETGSCMKVGDLYCPIVEVRDFPAETYPAIFDILNSAGVEYRWVTRWIGMNKVNASKLIDKYQKKFNNSRKSWGQAFGEVATGISSSRVDASSIAFEEETNEAKVALAKDLVSYGYYGSCIEVWDENYEEAMDKANHVAKLVNKTGFVAKVSGSNSFQAWLGMMPGNVYANVHKTLMSSANCTHIIPLSSVWTGDFYNNWTGGQLGCGSPLLVTSSYGSPFFLNLNVGDLFHSFIFGPSGAGKSTFLCLLETQFLKYPNAQVIVLDKDKTARGVCIASGGSYVEPGADSIAFQPLRDLESEEDMAWACEWIELCLTEQKVILNAQKSECIRQALCQLRDTKAQDRRDITTFQQYVQDEEIRIGIQPYTIDGQYGNIFDAQGSNINISNFTMIEMGILMRMGSACITPALMYIFKFIENHFAKPNDDKGHPTLLVLDEAWVFLDTPYFAARIEDWLLTLRKKRVAVVFATQEVAKAARSSISTTIVSQCLTRFYLADQNASSEIIAKYYEQFGLTPDEIGALSQARMKRDYFYKSPNGARMFQLELDQFQLALLNPQKAVLDDIERRYGRNSGKECAAEILEMQGIDTSRYIRRKE